MVVEYRYAVVVGASGLRACGNLLDDFMDLRCHGIAEYVERTEATISRLERVLANPPTIDIVVKVVLWANGLVHVCEVNRRCLSLALRTHCDATSLG